MTHLTEHEAAIAAARNCAAATTELLAFAREGEASNHFAFDDADTCEMLADALRTALQIDLERELRRNDQSERAPMQRDVIASLDRFLEGWA